MVGLTANEKYINGLIKIAKNFDDRIIDIDRTIVYFFGTRYNVEMDIIVSKSLIIEDAHDIGILLQQELEKQEEIERAFVHVIIIYYYLILFIIICNIYYF